MPSWSTQLQVAIGSDVITPIVGFTPNFSTPYTVIHSIEGANVGFVRGPSTFTFTMTVVANALAVAKLTQMALDGTSFDVIVAENTGTDWAFKSILFANCMITQASPSTITTVITGSSSPIAPGASAPLATFTCIALTVKLDKKVS